MEFDFLHNGQRLGWWQELEEPFTWTPQPTPNNPNPPTFTSNFRPYTLFALPFNVTWNGVYLQLTHHQVLRNIPTLYYHRQLKEACEKCCWRDRELLQPSLWARWLIFARWIFMLSFTFQLLVSIENRMKTGGVFGKLEAHMGSISVKFLRGDPMWGNSGILEQRSWSSGAICFISLRVSG